METLKSGSRSSRDGNWTEKSGRSTRGRKAYADEKRKAYWKNSKYRATSIEKYIKNSMYRIASIEQQA